MLLPGYNSFLSASVDCYMICLAALAHNAYYVLYTRVIVLSQSVFQEFLYASEQGYPLIDSLRKQVFYNQSQMEFALANGPSCF